MLSNNGRNTCGHGDKFFRLKKRTSTMRQIEDRLELRELTARYAYYVNTYRMDKIMDLWTEGARFDESRVGTGSYEGAPALRRCFEGLKSDGYSSGAYYRQSSD